MGGAMRRSGLVFGMQWQRGEGELEGKRLDLGSHLGGFWTGARCRSMRRICWRVDARPEDRMDRQFDRLLGVGLTFCSCFLACCRNR